ncbi:MAG: anion permease [Desulfobacterales bacterium]|nr:anion permease [Desulfobacterales bacterium]
MFSLLSGIFLGWSLGANDASNVIGSAVSSRMLKFRTAAGLAAVCVLIGALLEGRAGIETLKGLTSLTLQQAVISSIAAAATVTIMTVLGFPVATSQAVVGAILGIGLMNRQLNLGGLGKVVVCWLGTPIGGAVLAIFIYMLFRAVYNHLKIDLFQADVLIRTALIIAGSYAAYTLGANNVANVTAVFVAAGQLSVFAAALLGGASIGLGILTYSKPVITTVGSKLVQLDPFSALIVVIAEAITIHVYTFIGVPVSSSQALVGAIFGIGLVKGIKTVSRKTLKNILIAWFLTPIVATFIAIALEFAVHLEYVPYY